MTETIAPVPSDRSDATDGAGAPSRARAWILRVAVTLACALIGFLLVAQVRATENFGQRLEAEREEDLARILADLSSQSDKLQGEITDLRLLLYEFESSAESEEVALESLRKRLADLRILAGSVAAEGPGVVYTIEDPASQVQQDQLVDAVQELRDAGAEAIAVNAVRLVASSAFTTRNNRLLVDGQPLQSPYRIIAIGPAETLANALEIAGGTDFRLRALPDVTTKVQTRQVVGVPARGKVAPFVFGEPVPEQSEETG